MPLALLLCLRVPLVFLVSLHVPLASLLCLRVPLVFLVSLHVPLASLLCLRVPLVFLVSLRAPLAFSPDRFYLCRVHVSEFELKRRVSVQDFPEVRAINKGMMS